MPASHAGHPKLAADHSKSEVSGGVQLFAKLKALLRKAAARTRDSLWEVIGGLLDGVSPAECRNYLENAGYELD